MALLQPFASSWGLPLIYCEDFLFERMKQKMKIFLWVMGCVSDRKGLICEIFELRLSNSKRALRCLPLVRALGRPFPTPSPTDQPSFSLVQVQTLPTFLFIFSPTHPSPSLLSFPSNLYGFPSHSPGHPLPSRTRQPKLPLVLPPFTSLSPHPSRRVPPPTTTTPLPPPTLLTPPLGSLQDGMRYVRSGQGREGSVLPD